MKTIDESDLVSEVVRRSLCGELRQASLDVLVALFSAEPGDEDLSADADTGEESASVATAQESAHADSWDGPGGQTHSEPIILGPRAGELAPKRTISKYGRDQADPERRYRTTPAGRRIPLCSAPGCDSIVYSRGLCRRHGG